MDFDKYLMLLQCKIDYFASSRTPCLLYNRHLGLNRRIYGQKVSDYGRQSIGLAGRHTQMNMLAHRVMYMCVMCVPAIPRGMDVSHLCHNTLCLRFDHLSLEPHSVNMERQRCLHVTPILCLGHKEYPDCMLHVSRLFILSYCSVSCQIVTPPTHFSYSKMCGHCLLAEKVS